MIQKRDHQFNTLDSFKFVDPKKRSFLCIYNFVVAILDQQNTQQTWNFSITGYSSHFEFPK
jgi:uncharacterized membrane protein YwaF